MILVDTSIWVDHFRRRHEGLVRLLDNGQIVMHPFVVGEIALGGLRRRAEVLRLLADLPVAAVAGHDEVLALVERRGLAGAGIGWIDAHLLASAVVEGVPLWTNDRRLRLAARKLGVAREAQPDLP